MGIEFIQEIQDGVRMKRCYHNNHMFLVLRTVTAVRATLFLSLHPGEGKLLQLEHT